MSPLGILPYNFGKRESALGNLTIAAKWSRGSVANLPLESDRGAWPLQFDRQGRLSRGRKYTRRSDISRGERSLSDLLITNLHWTSLDRSSSEGDDNVEEYELSASRRGLIDISYNCTRRNQKMSHIRICDVCMYVVQRIRRAASTGAARSLPKNPKVKPTTRNVSPICVTAACVRKQRTRTCRAFPFASEAFLTRRA